MRLGLQLAFAGLVALATSQFVIAAEPPKFQIDTSWPKTLPNHWIVGQIGGIYVDSQDHIWVVHRPGTLTDREKRGGATPSVRCCVSAPPVIEFDQAGNVVQAWGGPGQGFEWPANEHGIYVDQNNFVWIGGNAEDKDGQVLKFTRDGKFVKQIGSAGKLTGSNDTTRLGRPADMIVDPATNELYVADGYGNHRVIVFDAATGAYKRHWGAYGKPPTDMKLPTYKGNQELPQQFTNPVHCIRMSNDGFIYVCDRGNNRIQVFDGEGAFKTQYVNVGAPSAICITPGPQQYLFASNSNPSTSMDNGEIYKMTLDGRILGKFGTAGKLIKEFGSVHEMDCRSESELYVGEITNWRVQKLTLKAK